MTQYLLIQVADKGETLLHWLDSEELRKFLADPLGTHGCDQFFDEAPEEHPEYWGERDALLLRVEILTPVQVSAFVLPPEQEENAKKAGPDSYSKPDTGPFRDDHLDLFKKPVEPLRMVFAGESPVDTKELRE